MIHNIPEDDHENLFVKLPQIVKKKHFKIDTSFANIHTNEPKAHGKPIITTGTGRLNMFTVKI